MSNPITRMVFRMEYRRCRFIGHSHKKAKVMAWIYASEPPPF